MESIEEWPLVGWREVVSAYEPGSSPDERRKRTLRDKGAMTAGVRVGTPRFGPYAHGQIRYYSSLNRLAAAMLRSQRLDAARAVSIAAGQLEDTVSSMARTIPLESALEFSSERSTAEPDELLVKLAAATASARRQLLEIGIGAETKVGYLVAFKDTSAFIESEQQLVQIDAMALDRLIRVGDPVVISSEVTPGGFAVTRVLRGIEIGVERPSELPDDPALDRDIARHLTRFDSKIELSPDDEEHLLRMKGNGVGARASDVSTIVIYG